MATDVATSYKNLILADSPTFYLPCQEAAGATTAVDASGNGYNFVESGTGDFGSVGPATGVTAYEITADQSWLVNTGLLDTLMWVHGQTLSLEGWYYHDVDELEILIGSSGADDVVWHVQADNDVAWTADNSVTTNDATWTGGFPGTGQWVYMGVVFREAADTAQLYVGLGVTSFTDHGSTAAATPFGADPDEVRIGAFGASTVSAWNGRFCHVAGYANRELTISEFRSHHKAMLKPPNTTKRRRTGQSVGYRL